MLGSSICFFRRTIKVASFTIISPRQATRLNPSLAIMFVGLLFQYGAWNCESIMQPSNNLDAFRRRGITLSWHYIFCGSFFFLETKSRNVFCFVVFVLLVMNSTAEILQPQMNTRRLLVRVLTLHEECDRICCEEKTKMLPQLKSNSCIMYFLAGEKTLPIGLDAAKHPKNMLAV